MPKREHQIPPGEGGPAAGSLGQSFGVGRLTLSADQIDHLHEEADWKPRARGGIPMLILWVALGVASLVLVALLVMLVVWQFAG